LGSGKSPDSGLAIRPESACKPGSGSYSQILWITLWITAPVTPSYMASSGVFYGAKILGKKYFVYFQSIRKIRWHQANQPKPTPRQISHCE
jgi:hypothetical protein